VELLYVRRQIPRGVMCGQREEDLAGVLTGLDHPRAQPVTRVTA
jgi:hypothetical protein